MAITAQQKSFLTNFWRNLLSPDLGTNVYSRFENVMGQYLDETGLSTVGIEFALLSVLEKTLKKMKLDDNVFTKVQVITEANNDGTITIYQDGKKEKVTL